MLKFRRHYFLQPTKFIVGKRMLVHDIHRERPFDTNAVPVVQRVHIPSDKKKLDTHHVGAKGISSMETMDRWPLATWESSSGLILGPQPQQQNGSHLGSYHYAPVSSQRGSWMSTAHGTTDSPRPQRQRKEVEPRRSFTPTITKWASDIHREGPTYERMQRKGEEYKAHIQALRHEKENQEIKEVRNTPQINKNHKKACENETGQGTPGASSDHRTVESRLLEKRKEYQSHVDAERQKQHEKEMCGVRNSPTLSKRTKEMTTHRKAMTASMQYWEAKKNEKVKIMKMKKEAAEMEEVQATPRVNARSRSMCANDALRKETPDVVERLLRQGEESKRRHVDLRVSQLKLQEKQAYPELHTAVIRDRSHYKVSDIEEEPWSVFERLHQESRDIAVRKLERVVTQSVQTTFSPRINRLSIKLSGGDISGSEPIHERLIRCGEEAQKRRAEEARRIGREVAQQAEVSHYLGAYTTLLGELNRSGTPHSRGPVPFHTALRASLSSSPAPPSVRTHSPHIGENSRRMDEAMNGVTRSPMARVERLLSIGKERTVRLERAKADKFEQEKIDSMLRSGKKGTNASETTPTRDMYARHMEWQCRVRNATNRTRAQIAEEEESRQRAACSFSPRLNPNREGKRAPSFSNTKKDTGPVAKWVKSSSTGDLAPPIITTSRQGTY